MPPNRFRTGYVAGTEEGAELAFAKVRTRRWAVHYTPAPEAIRIAKQADKTFLPPSKPILLIEGDPRSDVVVLHPLNTTATSPSFLEPKYGRLRTMTLEGFDLSEITSSEELSEALQSLPPGFIKDPFFGLGLYWDLRYITDAIARLPGVTDMRLRRGVSTGLPVLRRTSYVLSAKAFDDARKAINRAHDKALTIAADEKRAYVHNALLTTLDPKSYPPVQRAYRKDAVLDAIGASLARTTALSPRDREAVVAATTSAARSVNRTKPEALLELSREIEVITLEGLMHRLRAMLAKKVKEDAWQDFFLQNPFVLRLAFGLPIMIIGDHISVGGRKFSGAGDKITDFAVKAAISGNLSLVEIKTSETPLIETTPYRGELHGPSRELSGAVNQVLDQRYQLQKSITLLKDTSGVFDVETYAVLCLVIAGRSPEGKAQLKSFELFRNALKSVTVITFDELLRKLEHLLELLRGTVVAPGPTSSQETDEEFGTVIQDPEADLD